MATAPTKRLTVNQGFTSGTTVAHLTDTKTGNVYPVVVQQGSTHPPGFNYPGTQNSVVVSGRGLPTGGSGVWWSPSSTTPPTYAKPGGSTCTICQNPMFPWLVVGGVLLVLLLIAASHRS